MNHEPSELLGRRHPLIKRLRALRHDSSLRRKEAVLVAEGLHLAQEALACGVEIETVVVAPRLTRNQEGAELLQTIERRGLNCAQTSDAVLDSLQDARSPQPVAMIVRRPCWSAEDLMRGAAPLIAVACSLQDPGNLGTLIRTTEAAGAGGCLLQGPCADAFHPRTVRASAGSILRLPVLIDADGTLLEGFAGRGGALFAADAHGTTDYDRCDFTKGSAILFGGEGGGLSAELLSRADRTVRVPLQRGVESLSVPAAAAVILFEAARQRARG